MFSYSYCFVLLLLCYIMSYVDTFIFPNKAGSSTEWPEEPMSLNTNLLAQCILKQLQAMIQWDVAGVSSIEVSKMV